jgi:hypothetical protein
VALNHTGVDPLIAQQIQHMRKMRFAMHGSDFHPIDPSAFVHLLNLPIGQTLTPANHGQSALSLRRITSTKNLQQSRLIAAKGIGEDRWSVVLAKPLFGILHQRQCVLVRAFAHP